MFRVHLVPKAQINDGNSTFVTKNVRFLNARNLEIKLSNQCWACPILMGVWDLGSDKLIKKRLDFVTFTWNNFTRGNQVNLKNAD